MTTANESKTTYKLSVGTILAYILVGLAFMSAYIATSTFNGALKARFIDLIYGNAFKPYVYRVFTTQSIRLIAKLIPLMQKNKSTHI